MRTTIDHTQGIEVDWNDLPWGVVQALEAEGLGAWVNDVVQAVRIEGEDMDIRKLSVTQIFQVRRLVHQGFQGNFKRSSQPT